MKTFMMFGLATFVLASGCEKFESIPPNETEKPADTSVKPPEDTAVAEEVAEAPVTMLAVDAVAEASTKGLAPWNIHLTWDDAPASTVVVHWSLDAAKVDGYIPRVWYYEESEKVEDGGTVNVPFSTGHVATGACRKYKEVFVGLMAGEDEFGICEVKITGLKPRSKYFYRAGTWQGDAALPPGEGAELAGWKSFKSGVAKGSNEKVTLMLAGDSRGGYAGIQANVDRLAAMNPDFWLFNGDMNESGKQAEWDSWFGAMAPVTENFVLMPVQGNHEMYANVFYEQFALPPEPELDADIQEYAWSIDYGRIHIIGMNSNTEETVLSQKEWLEKDLAAATEDSDTDWILVMFHHPVYSASGKHGSTLRCKKEWVPIMEKYHVDMVFGGHDHNYERTYPIRNDRISEGDGIVYLVAGGFYSPGYSNGTDWWTVISHHGDKHNYVYIEIEGNTLQAVSYSGDGNEILDEFTIQK